MSFHGFHQSSPNTCGSLTLALIGLLSQLWSPILANAQWHTSTNADSALFVCSGFNQGILTFDDGSSIICGALSDSRYVQKLDANGYKSWPQPVQLYDRPGTDNDGGAMEMVSDGDGGVILWWGDFRGAFLEVDDVYSRYLNNAVYIQHVDKSGTIRWEEGGMLVDSVRGGVKYGYGVSDGAGGIVLYLYENLYDTTSGVLSGSHTWLAHYDNNGQLRWSDGVDTSNSALYAGQPVRLGDRIEIGTLKGPLIVDLVSGIFQTPPTYSPRGKVITYRDSIGYDLKFEGYQADSLGVTALLFGLTCIGRSWDSLWHADFKIDDESDGTNLSTPLNTSLVVDQRGGVFYVWTYRNPNNIGVTRAHWITSRGIRWGAKGMRLAQKSCYAIFNGSSRVGMYFSDGTAQAFDTLGSALWDTGVVVISNPLDAYSPTFSSDNNGGAIIAFWTTLGGIFAQHTGRAGKVGVTTNLPAQAPIVPNFELYQNYPNPFNPTTTIRYELPSSSMVRLSVYDILGREVSILVDERKNAGSYEVKFDGSNLSSGVYFYQLQAGTFVQSRKLLLLR